ncbi:hypothetical protein LINPERHAP1_LOCUS8189, partial [Linum perenne]
MKEIFTNKRKLTDVTSAKLNEQCSAILSKKPPEKLKDPVMCRKRRMKQRRLHLLYSRRHHLWL